MWCNYQEERAPWGVESQTVTWKEHCSLMYYRQRKTLPIKWWHTIDCGTHFDFRDVKMWKSACLRTKELWDLKGAGDLLFISCNNKPKRAPNARLEFVCPSDSLHLFQDSQLGRFRNNLKVSQVLPVVFFKGVFWTELPDKIQEEV